MKKIQLFLLLLFMHLTVFAQTVVKGFVLDSISNQPLANVSIYVNGSNIETISDGKGYFNIDITNTTQPLVFTLQGYNTRSIEWDKKQVNNVHLNVKMVRELNELEEVFVQSTRYKKVSLKDWKPQFLNFFIGTGRGASDCQIANISDITLLVSEKNDKLKAKSNKTLLIHNKWSGYDLLFDMQDFEVDLLTGTVVNYGFVHFKETNNSKKTLKKRAELYQGSFPHFIKSLFNNRLMEEGFVVHRVHIDEKRIAEKNRIKQMLYLKADKGDFEFNPSDKLLRIGNSSPDSSSYYYQVYTKAQSDNFLMDSSLQTQDSLIVTNLDAAKEMYFKGNILVTYKRVLSDAERLLQRAMFADINNNYENSILSLKDDNSVFIYANGMISPPRILEIQGFWRESNAIKNLLPFDYEPNKK